MQFVMVSLYTFFGVTFKDFFLIFGSFCRSINRRVVLFSFTLTFQYSKSGISLDIGFNGSFAEFVYLWLACVASS